jgi:hypothetical protein
MAKSKLRLWRRFGKWSSAVILACFLLPFFGVSCGGMDMVTASGTDMVGGCRPGGLLMDAQDQQKHHSTIDEGDADAASGDDMDMKIDNVDREPLAIVALGLCVALLAMAFLRTRGALVGAMLLSIAALATLGGLWVKVTKKIDNQIAELDKKDPGASDPESVALRGKLDKDMKVDAGSRYGLWMVVLGLVGTAAVTGLALKEREDQSALGDGST